MHELESPQTAFFRMLLLLERSDDHLATAAPELMRRAICEEVGGSLLQLGEIAGQHHERVYAIFVRHRLELGCRDCAAIKGLLRGGRADQFRCSDRWMEDYLLLALTERVLQFVISVCETCVAMASELGFHAEASILQELQTEKAHHMKVLHAKGDRLLKARPGQSSPGRGMCSGDGSADHDKCDDEERAP